MKPSLRMSLWRKIWIIAGAALGVVVAVACVRHFQLKGAADAYVAKLKAGGEPLEWAQVIPRTTPSGLKMARSITNVFSQLLDAYDFTNSIVFNNNPAELTIAVAPGKRIVGWRQPLIYNPSGYQSPTNTWDELGFQLAAQKGNLEELRRLVQGSMLDFNLDYRKEVDPRLPAILEGMKWSANWLAASTYYNLHQGNSAAACADVRALLALVQDTADQRLEISQLVRVALAKMGADDTWAILQDKNVADADLARLQQGWPALDFCRPLRNAFLVERVRELEFLARYRKSKAALSKWLWPVFVERGYGTYKRIGEGASARWELVDESSWFKKLFHSAAMSLARARWRWFWSYSDELRSLKLWRAGIQAAQMSETNRSFQAVRSYLDRQYAQAGFESGTNNPYARFTRSMDLLPLFERAMTAETVRNIVVTAIALRRYQLRQGDLPKSLHELSPEFLKTVPVDCMDGTPLRYERINRESFLLYSVGVNGVDDGGDASKHSQPAWADSSNWPWMDQRVLDWVWPEPAAATEVQAWMERRTR